MKKTNLTFLLFIPFLSFSQTWLWDSKDSSFFLKYKSVPKFENFLESQDSCFYFFTHHLPEKSWKRKNENKDNLFLNKIDKKGNVSLLKEMNKNLIYGHKVYFLNKYYCITNDQVVKDGKSLSKGYIFNSNWEKIDEFYIPSLDKNYHRISKTFLIDSSENFYMYENKRDSLQKREVYVGANLYKFNKNGALLKSCYFQKAKIGSFKLMNGNIELSYEKQNKDNYYFTDSIANIICNYDLELVSKIVKAAKKPNDPININHFLNLKNGNQVIIYDSSFSNGLNYGSLGYIALKRQDGSFIWRKNKPTECFTRYENLLALNDSDFFVECYQRFTPESSYDSRVAYKKISYLKFESNGKQTLLKQFAEYGEIYRKGRSTYNIYMADNKWVYIFYHKSNDVFDSKLHFLKLAYN